MTLDIIPNIMRAKHFETGEWTILFLDDHACNYWGQSAIECYYAEDFSDEPYWADLGEYEAFEAVAT
jgi:hypothetical protein